MAETSRHEVGSIASKLTDLAELIRNTANELEPLQTSGGLEETLKWNQLSFLPVKKGIGTTIRIGQASETEVALYVHCQTTLVDTYRSLFRELKFQGNRAILLDVDEPLPIETLKACVAEALLYHLNKKQRR